MKNVLIISGVFALLILGLFVYFYTSTREVLNWESIQKIGGIKIGVPIKTGGVLYLPVLCNVSGTDSITTKPTVQNSALSCIKIKSTTSKNTIHLMVVSGISDQKKDNCNCKPVKIGRLKSGNYLVYYGEKSSFDHPIGKFTIE